MRKHTEDLPCKVPFCKECLANIKGLANTAKDMMTNPKQAPIETELLRTTMKVVELASPKIVYAGGDTSKTPRVSIDAIAIAKFIQSQVLEGRIDELDEFQKTTRFYASYLVRTKDHRIAELQALLTKSKEIK